MLSLNELSMSFGGKVLFTGVNLNLQPNNRYALVGSNGSGKSTLLKILAGEEHSLSGAINMTKGSQIGWLKQDQFLYDDDLIVNAVIRGNKQLWQALSEQQILLQKKHISEKEGYRLAELEAIIASNNGYTAESTAQILLSGLGIPSEQHFEPLKVLSGGYKLRVLLAQVLFSNPEIMLLDEPTNHLDILTIAWLEKYLIEQFKGILIFVSHDLAFINNTATHILDIDYGEIRLYHGNFEKFTVAKQEVLQQKMHELSAKQEKIEQLQNFVDRFRAKASKARQAKSKEKMIDRIELPEIEATSRIAPRFAFTMKHQSAKKILSIKAINKSFNDKNILRNVSFDVTRGNRIAIIGHNGIGKSTLLKIITNNLAMDSGTFAWDEKVNYSYFPQEHTSLINPNDTTTIYDWLYHHAAATSQEVYNSLGAMLFQGELVHKPVNVLSGGEAARLVFAKIMLDKPNVIILDEPTNHLDLESITSLQEHLNKFPGTIILVSHDRSFVGNIANRIIAISENGIKDHHGDYQDYLTKVGSDYLSNIWLAQHPL